MYCTIHKTGKYPNYTPKVELYVPVLELQYNLPAVVHLYFPFSGLLGNKLSQCGQNTAKGKIINLSLFFQFQFL